MSTEVKNEIARVEDETTLHGPFDDRDLKETGAPEIEMTRIIRNSIGSGRRVGR